MFAKSEWQMLLDAQIARAVSELGNHEINSPEYKKTLEGLSTLYRIKEEDKSRFGSKDNLTAVVGNLVGILMILKYEKVGVITSKAMSFLPKAKIKP